MAKNISWLGNVYTNVPAITLPQQGGGTALFTEVSPTTAYGVYGYDINSSGRVRIYQRYNSNYSLTINGTYRVQIYSLAFPDGKSPYNTGQITGTI